MKELCSLNNKRNEVYVNYIKRVFDVTFSVAGLAVLAVPMLGVTVLIMQEDKGNPIFTQKRFGKDQTYFDLYKFRSMRMDTPHDIPTHELTNPEQYMLKIGKTIRKFSIDELPQLINIIKGEMSIIGPRPALWNQEDLIAEREKYGANSVKPGLTGWAQINGRDELEISEKARLDGEYANNIGFRMDCKCFFGTFLKVLKHDGVVEGGTGALAVK